MTPKDAQHLFYLRSPRSNAPKGLEPRGSEALPRNAGEGLQPPGLSLRSGLTCQQGPGEQAVAATGS